MKQHLILLFFFILLVPPCLSWTDCYATKCRHYNGSYMPCDGSRKKCEPGTNWQPEAVCRNWHVTYLDVEVTCYLNDVCVHDNVTGIPSCVVDDFETEDENEGWGYKCWNDRCWSDLFDDYIECDMERHACFYGKFCEPRRPSSYISKYDYAFCPSWKNCTVDKIRGEARCFGSNSNDTPISGGEGFKLSTLQIIGLSLTVCSAVCGLCYAACKCWLVSDNEEQVEYEPGAQVQFHQLESGQGDTELQEVDVVIPPSEGKLVSDPPPPYPASSADYAVPPPGPPPPDCWYSYSAPPTSTLT